LFRKEKIARKGREKNRELVFPMWKKSRKLNQ
jgi:hypothetical protein